MNDSISTLVGEITFLAVKISLNTKADVFVDFYAHVKQLSIRYFSNGYEDDVEPVLTEVYLKWEEWVDATEESVIEQLESIKRNLHALIIKINWEE